jgi:hypothetical protein
MQQHAAPQWTVALDVPVHDARSGSASPIPTLTGQPSQKLSEEIFHLACPLPRSRSNPV